LAANPFKGPCCNQAQHKEVAPAKTVRRFPFLAIIVGALEGDVEHRVFVGFLPPNAGADDAVAHAVDGLVPGIP